MVQIDFAPGAHGNLLCRILNKYLFGHSIRLFDSMGTSHTNQILDNKNISNRAIARHYYCSQLDDESALECCAGEGSLSETEKALLLIGFRNDVDISLGAPIIRISSSSVHDTVLRALYVLRFGNASSLTLKDLTTLTVSDLRNKHSGARSFDYVMQVTDISVPSQLLPKKGIIKLWLSALPKLEEQNRLIHQYSLQYPADIDIEMSDFYDGKLLYEAVNRIATFLNHPSSLTLDEANKISATLASNTAEWRPNYTLCHIALGNVEAELDTPIALGLLEEAYVLGTIQLNHRVHWEEFGVMPITPRKIQERISECASMK